MSNEITCKTCGFANPHSSKFCNNCGAKLPLSTHIICPSCETPNTRDRIFCDTCGTRLVPETNKLKPEEPAETPPPANEPFSLPTRRPGDTGELNPNAVPDWLRTGDIASTNKDEEALGPDEAEQKGPSDLPEWLVHDSDPDPIINAPTTISTEFYQDLLDRAEDVPQPDDLFPDDEGANLPDWLADADEKSRSADVPTDVDMRAGLTGWLSDLDEGAGADDTAVPENQFEEDVSSGLTTWLSELEDESGTEETAVADETAEEDISGGLTSWLHELDDLGGSVEEEPLESAWADESAQEGKPNVEPDSADWLHELGPAQTDVFPLQKDASDEEAEDEMPGWMDELGPIQTNLLAPDQIAKLTGPLAEFAEDTEIVDDEDAGSEASFTSLFETASHETENISEWLGAAPEDMDAFIAEIPDESLDEPDQDVAASVNDWLSVDDIDEEEADLSWLSDDEAMEAIVEESSASLEPERFAFDTVEAPDDDAAFAEDDFDFIDEPLSEESEFEEPVADLSGDTEDDFDWLSDMEAIETGELVLSSALEAAELWGEPADDTKADQPEEREPTPVAEQDSGSWNSDALFAEAGVGEDLPDWLEQLDETDRPVKSAQSDESEEELPEWIASMRPGQGMISSELPGVFAEMDLRDTLEGIPEELAGAELPSWLQDTPLDSPAPSTPIMEGDEEAPTEIPDWLQPKEEDAESILPTLGVDLDAPDTGGSRNEWSSLLEELPPLTPLADTLPKAEIPEWVQQLKPTELTGELPREPEGPEEISGPLKGMHGIVAIEPVIAKPRSVTLPTPYLTTPEQQQQVALLQQLAKETPETVTMLSAQSVYVTAVWLRLSVAILLIAGLVLGLRGPSLVATTATNIPAHVQAVDTAVAAAAGEPVLVALEYTPAMAGELTPQAELLLAQLAANDSPVLITSQYAAGTAVANNLMGDGEAQLLGYLPGEAIGLRQLGDCLSGRNECSQLNGRLLDEDVQATLKQTHLIIVITGDRDNLVNWIEQVGTVATDLPLVAGVTQALTPLARSYTTTTQLSGLLGGIPDTAAYEQLLDLPESSVQSQLNAQIWGQLLAGALLLVGLVAYGATGLLNRRRGRR